MTMITGGITWWLHTLLAVIGYFTGLVIYPEELMGTSSDQWQLPSHHDDPFCHADVMGDSFHQLARDRYGQPNGYRGLVVLPGDAKAYGRAREQYGSITYPDQLHPSMVTHVRSEADVQAAVTYAKRCGYTVSIRSGGHSYLGSSSCNSAKGACMQIDVTHLDHARLMDEEGRVQVGPGIRLKNLAEFLKTHHRFVVTGECPNVALGGHMQTGGFGLWSRHFGPNIGFVESFNIVLADGSLVKVFDPDVIEKEEIRNVSPLNNDLFYAVAGGASGSWGVVTDVILKTIDDTKYFSVYWKVAFKWNTQKDTDGIVNMMRTWAEMAQQPKYRDDRRWGIHWGIMGAKNVGKRNNIQMEASWVAPIAEKDEYDYQFFETILQACTGCNRYRGKNITQSMSHSLRYEYVREDIAMDTGREFPLPYTRAIQQSSSLPTPNQIEAIIRKLGTLMPSWVSTHVIISQMTAIKGVGSDDTRRALPWPEDQWGVTLDMFYYIPGAHRYETMAMSFAETMKNNMGPNDTSVEDHRMFWGAYGQPDLLRDWHMYYESREKFDRLRAIKARVDPTNLFQNSMSMPLPDATMMTAETS